MASKSTTNKDAKVIPGAEEPTGNANNSAFKNNPNFKKSVKDLFAVEGGFSNHAQDSGGWTKLGVTKAVLEAHRGKSVTEQDVVRLTEKEASAIYKARYWDKVMADEINSAMVADEVFEMAVNSGVPRGSRIFQEAINSFDLDNPIAVDGIVGPKTIKAANDLIKAGKETALYNSMNFLQLEFYIGLVASNPKKYSPFIKGWVAKRVKFNS